jgi:N-acetylgalactosamine-N,N'-diacetylbacillosaminyl-diphospho-undecaprenol 4-alpha-N-acetylgalactosaminyltransferase
MKIKNILFLVISMNKGGAERVVSILLKHLEANPNATIHLVMMEDGIAYDLPSTIKPIILYKGEKSGLRKLFELPFIAWKVSKIVKKHEVDTIVSFLYRPNYINILTKLFGYKGRSIINIRSTTSRYLNEGLLGKINLLLIKSLFNKADLIISNSDGVKKDLNSLINITTKHISIPNPIDLAKVKNLTLKPEVKKLEENIEYIISVGRLIPLKRNRDLLLAFSKIYQELSSVKLLFLGDGVLLEELKSYSESLGIKDKVVFLGNVDNPFYFLKKSKLFVMTSEIEGFPNVLIEAMACGLPVISSNCKSGPSEILEDNKYGILFEVGDTDILSENILKVMKDKKLQHYLAKQALKRANYYNVDKIITKFKDEILS